MRELRGWQWIWLSWVIDFLCMMLSMSERPGGLTVKNRQACASPAPYKNFQFIFSRTVKAYGWDVSRCLKKTWFDRIWIWVFTHLECLLFTMFSYPLKKASQKWSTETPRSSLDNALATGSCTDINDELWEYHMWVLHGVRKIHCV